MKIGIVSDKSIKSLVSNAVKNTTNFENCSTFTEYNYDDDSDKITNTLNLCIPDNYILEEIVPYLKDNSPSILFTEEQRNSFYGKPMSVSKSYYGVTDYWWIILAVNGYFSASEFKGWNALLMPEIATISKILDKVSFTNDDLGVVPNDSDSTTTTTT